MKKPGLPSSPRTPGREQFDTAVKETLEIITGRRGVKVSPITGSYDVERVAKKLNELINFFHGGGEPASDELTFSGSENPWLSNVSGSNAVTADASPAPEAYVAGQVFRFVSAGANTGPVTLNISSLGVRNVTKTGAVALSAGDIPSGAVVEVVFDGTRFQVSNVSSSGGVGRLIGYQVFTAGGTYAKATNNPSFVVVEVVGAGGGGGGGSNAAATGGGGGGAGGYAIKNILSATLGASETVTIGAAGTAGNTSGSNGGAGGTTSFGAHVSATGGSGGTGSTAAGQVAGGVGGNGSSGDLNLTGGRGGAGHNNSGGHGGNGVKGGGGGINPNSGTTGTSTGYDGASNTGGGGAGGHGSTSGGGGAGGAGGSGLVIVWEYA